MTPVEREQIGRAWIAAGGGWREGMLAGGGVPRRVLFMRAESWSSTYGYDLPLERKPGRRGPNRPPSPTRDPKAWPDFRDAATRGAALEVVRERWGAPEGHLYPFERKAGVRSWVFRRFYGADFTSEGDSEAAALLAALEAAPKVSR